MKNITIVIPLYNEEKRLKKLFTNISNFNSNKKIEFIFVDDGSKDNTFYKIEFFIKKIRNRNKKFILVKSNKNLGKGGALKLGVSRATNNWIFTMDADLSVNFNQINIWIKKYTFNNNYAYFGSRNHISSNVMKKLHRRIMGIAFQFLVFIFFDKNIKDSQCGFKLYNKLYAKQVFKNLKTQGFAHDLEIIKLLKSKKIIIRELPIKWRHEDNGKLNILTDPFKMLFDIFLIKLR